MKFMTEMLNTHLPEDQQTETELRVYPDLQFYT